MRRVVPRSAATLEELSALEAGEYYIYLGTITEGDDCSESYSDVFRLIVE